jgi:SAM-dependent methyltransferase
VTEAAYYNYQAEARGLKTEADVELLTKQMSAVYSKFLPMWLPRDRNAAIYEVACGPGIMLRYLTRTGYNNTSGSDSSLCQVELARAAGLNVVQADSLSELEKHPDVSCDCIIGIDFIEHLPKDALIEFFLLASKKLKPGGSLILRAPNGDSPFVGRNLFNDITHVWAYTTTATRALLQMAGFRQIEFADESLAMLQRHAPVKRLLMKCAQRLLRTLIRGATREDIHYLNPSIYIRARK